MEKSVKKRKQIAVLIQNSKDEINDRLNIDTKRYKYDGEYRSKMLVDVTYSIDRLVQKEIE